MARIQGLLDTNILIEIWRKRPNAIQWAQAQPPTMGIGLPVIAFMELLDGAQNQAQRQQALQFLQPYPVVHLTRDDSKWAQAQHAQFKLSHGLGIGDALIAAPAARLQVPLFTLNTKHFAPLTDVTVIRPCQDENVSHDSEREP